MSSVTVPRTARKRLVFPTSDFKFILTSMIPSNWRKPSPKRQLSSFAVQGVIFSTPSGTKGMRGKAGKQRRMETAQEEFHRLTKKTEPAPKPKTSHTAEQAFP